MLAAAKEAAAKEAAAAQAAANEPIPVVEGGRAAGQTTPEAARKDGLTVVDLSDDWLPYVFSETPEKPQPLRPFLLDLANGRMRPGKSYARPREDRFFEAFGIFPSLNLVRRRLADKKRHACHDRVKDAVLEELAPKNVIPPEELEKIPNPNPATRAETPMITTGRTISPRPLTPSGEAGRDRDAGPPALRGSAVRQGDPRPDGSPDGRGPEGLPAPAPCSRTTRRSISTPAPC